MAIAEPAATTADVVHDDKSTARRSTGTAKKRAARKDTNSVMRFFLGKVEGKKPALDREVATEKEALLESLKTGQTYFAVSEWRAVADLSKEIPQIRKEFVSHEERG